eukprot:CAMPEP_0172356940 /NCGR_PEP_ID=MMETSP1060-20121228/1304_1 /TAXON_ID=37318 /ORGANISM="Pseudo-nitzschia pungens, Strain cf. cingulata" /LENGTH=168 /DNA_ID=CAMNT_0013077339 /DNA_START=52 /DNA_END=558 /DNA_ORIENTATION=+
MIQRNDLATKALVKTMEDGGFQPTLKSVSLSCFGTTSMLSSGATKRSSPMKRSLPSCSGPFDMGDFLKASEQVEETIAFPSIQWPSLDDEDSDLSSDDDTSYSAQSQSSLTRSREDRDEDDDYESFSSLSSRKRQCRGLTRCHRSCNLSSLWNMSAPSERRGSTGSLS